MRKWIVLLLAICGFAALSQDSPIVDSDGMRINGYIRVTIIAYSQETGGSILWSGTTDGSLPSLRVEGGMISNLQDILPLYIKRSGDLWIDILRDGEPMTSDRLSFRVDTSLRRDIPPGEIMETLDDELRIGNPGLDEELYVASARTGFGIDAPLERVEIDGVIGIKEGTAPTASTDFGKVYVDGSDGHLYYMDEGGTATDLLETSSVMAGGIITHFSTEQMDICIGKTIYLGVHQSTSSGPYTHLWTGDTSPLSATDIPNPSFTAGTPGTYNLQYTVTDGEGGSSVFYFTVTAHDITAPTITASPSSGGCTGEPVQLVANGCYDVYCWEEGPCTKVFDVTESGTYHLNVRDQYGCEATAEYTVTFLPPPTVDPGTNISVCQGSTDPIVGGSPSASGGTPPYFYEWSGTGAPYLSSTNVANPTFDAGASEGAYNLSLEVIDGNGCRSVSSPITVTIWGNPSISASSNSPVCMGNTINLTSTPTGGSTPYTFTWNGPSGYSSSAQNPTIPSATLSHAGTYTVTVTDVHGCFSSMATTEVAVLNLPEISANPADLTRCEGESAIFTISATGDGLIYQWQVDDGGGFSNISGETTPTLTLSSVSYAMDGNVYRCMVTGSCSPSATSTGATLTVREPAGIVTDPDDVTICEDSPATFSITASGYSITYQWEQSTDGGSSWSNMSGETGGSLTVTPSDDSWDSYRYRCTVTDGCGGSETSGHAILSVNAIPIVTVDPVNQTVGEGDAATFSITATGTGLTYQWQQNTGSGWADIAGAMGTSYTVSSVSAGMDGYQYRCIASGDCEPPDTSSAATLNVSTELFAFTSHTFTNCGATGYQGPTLSQCRSTYTTSWDEDDAFFNMGSQGIQRWTVPADGSYRITAAGAQAGRGPAAIGGNGAIMIGTFALSRNDTLLILVGQQGNGSTSICGSGGGGSFVVAAPDHSSATVGDILIIAGGGGGGGQTGGFDATQHGSTSTAGNRFPDVAAGGAGTNGGGGGGGGHSDSAGAGGNGTDGSDGQFSTGGGGFLGNGGGAIYSSQDGGFAFVNGGNGSWINSSVVGGFGGGSSIEGQDRGAGAGGGFSGGGGGPASPDRTGGGGGSINNGTAQDNTAGGNTGHGYVIIEKL